MTHSKQYQFNISVPLTLVEEESEKLFQFGATSVSSKETKDSFLITAIFDKNPEDIPDLDTSSGTIDILDPSEWMNSWIEHYEPVKISDELIVIPQNFQNDLSRDYTYEIICDPKDAFGHGGHPTTKMCLHHLLQLIVNSDIPNDKITLLDAGTGTGLLAILGAMMGCSVIDAFDYDYDAVTSASKNAKLNNISTINIFKDDIFTLDLKKSYHIITANLLTDILLKVPTILKSHLKDEGYLILSGIGSQWRKEIISTYEEAGFQVFKEDILHDWTLFILRINS